MDGTDMQPRLIAVGVLVLAALAGAFYWWWTGRTVVETTSTAPASPAAQTSTREGPGIATPAPASSLGLPATEPVLPALDASDDFVRTQVGALSERLGDWLAQDDLVRRFAVVIENGARGEVPRRQLTFLAPPAKFPVREVDGRLFVDPAGYGRFDGFVDTVLSVPPEQAAALLRTLAPLLREALAELGVEQPDPIAAVRAAIAQALRTPDLEGDVELVQPQVLYRYADPALEALPPITKQLLRMGGVNVTRIKSYLREVQGYL
jgi:hypothetical protein